MANPTRALIAALSLALVLGACGKSPEEKAAELALKAATGGDATVERDGDATKMTVQTDQGAMTVQSGEGLSVPAGFPGDIYLPAGHKVENVTQIGPMSSVVLGLTGKPQDMAQEITSKMAAGGWKTAMSMQHGDGAMVSFSKEKRSATYSLSPSQDGGKLTVSVQHITEAN